MRGVMDDEDSGRRNQLDTASCHACPPRGATSASVKMEILRAQVTAENLTDQDVRRLVPGDAEPIASAEVQLGEVTPGATAFARGSISFGGADSGG